MQGGSSTPIAGYQGDLQPKTEKHNINLLGSYEFSDALRFFVEAKYVKTKNFSFAQPSFDFFTTIQADNPFIPAAIRSAIVPDALPAMVSVGLFWWEFNVRASTVLGVVGAGGIGQELKNSMDLLDFPRLATIIALILVMVTVIDFVSERVRRRLE